ncbi:hypothetical protein CEXT_663981 [Caerostris extrusa]|uniref:Uncharacterized protein n=1 Tax=Caerostris extrusa TaxID=172846 RepID=A0AAV4M8J5_CAEEX|nr:hypothetical protein CEXT_663981 [Caerostris extrusa]
MYIYSMRRTKRKLPTGSILTMILFSFPFRKHLHIPSSHLSFRLLDDRSQHICHTSSHELLSCHSDLLPFGPKYLLSRQSTPHSKCSLYGAKIELCKFKYRKG